MIRKEDRLDRPERSDRPERTQRSGENNYRTPRSSFDRSSSFKNNDNRRNNKPMFRKEVSKSSLMFKFADHALWFVVKVMLLLTLVKHLFKHCC